ncbi:PREDICTED: uncharacterized protein LOC105538747 [Mandrillus leucophaeus]|uniref:uncharacterized protein LOC105538747 n=1 Tax=Mandrillus leucophaeus TaxID=9568 RepID=UPI0005F4FF2D|nr:PREDICTED: uncharacterized protein LOC105538747 [Mandrillus leucophaeus]
MVGKIKEVFRDVCVSPEKNSSITSPVGLMESVRISPMQFSLPNFPITCSNTAITLAVLVSKTLLPEVFSETFTWTVFATLIPWVIWPQPDFSEAHQNLELRSEDQVLPREVSGQRQESGAPLPVPRRVTSHEGTKVGSQENQEACVMRGLQAGPGEAFWRNFLSRSPEFAIGFYVCLWTKVWRVTSSSEVVEEPADGGTTEGSMGEQRELQESNNDHEGFKDYASLHLRYTNWQFHHLKENLQGKDVYNDTKTFQRYHGPKGLSPRGSMVCSRP